jgi:HEAT repeat protein
MRCWSALEPSLADPDRWNRERALSFVSYLGTPKAFDRLVAFLGDARPDMRAEAACMLGDAGYDRGALAVIEELLRKPESLIAISSSERSSICARARMPT